LLILEFFRRKANFGGGLLKKPSPSA
jgi:hypothetical protein